MNKEKEIDWNLVKLIEEVADDYQGDILIKVADIQDKVNQSRSDCPLDDNIAWFANYLQDSGYGNVEKAVKRFAEEVKTKVYRYEEVDGENVCEDIDELLYEICGEKKK